MNKKNILITIGTIGIIAILCVFVIAWQATVSRRSLSTTASQQKFDTKVYVAIVNNEGIERTTYEQQAQQRSYFADWLKAHNQTSEALQTPVIDELINQTITLQFAKEQNLIPTDAEIAQKYQAAVASVGTETQYLSKMQNLQGIGKEEILERIKLEIIQANIEAKTHQPFAVWLNEEKQRAKIEKASNI